VFRDPGSVGGAMFRVIDVGDRGMGRGRGGKTRWLQDALWSWRERGARRDGHPPDAGVGVYGGRQDGLSASDIRRVFGW
jgi:hypothetical protein